MNGLKLTNDIFGHAAGDLLLKKVARVLKMNCRADDIIARIGGDEFTILLPRTDAEEAATIITRIKSQLEQESVETIKGSISMGCDTKTGMYQDMAHTLENAEARMYAEKTIDRINAKSGTIKTIIGSLHKASAREGLHSENVSRLNERLGKYMALPEAEVRKLKEAGFLHDIGKIILDEALIEKNRVLTEDETKKLRQHPLVGYRILNSFAETLDIAEIALAHHEKWDGSGYPRGLKGGEIPLLSRIMAVAESYDDMTNRLNQVSLGKEEALKDIRKMAGSRFDPEIVNIFSRLSEENELN
jgi:diguanylate cyclase (GGDEF)-like protein/putative nucleotidyltransferase with HDIG domain